MPEKEKEVSESLGKAIEIEVQGNMYQVTPFTIGMLIDMEKYIRSNRYKEVKEMGLEGSEKVDMLKSVMHEQITEKDKNDFMSSMEGIVFVAHKQMVKTDSDLTYDDVKEMFSINPTEINELLTAAFGLSDIDVEDNLGNVKKLQAKVSS